MEYVNRAAKSLKVPIPKVKFWEEDCPEYSGKERAHIHIEECLICISKRDLKHMTYEDIEDCATHEVTHLKDKHTETEHVHSPDFYRRHDNLKANTWRPSGGVVVIDGSSTSKKEKEEHSKPKSDKVYCNYHLCREKRELEQCHYCKKYFCYEHINPIEPGWYGPAQSKLFRNPIKLGIDKSHPNL